MHGLNMKTSGNLQGLWKPWKIYF